MLGGSCPVSNVGLAEPSEEFAGMDIYRGLRYAALAGLTYVISGIAKSAQVCDGMWESWST